MKIMELIDPFDLVINDQETSFLYEDDASTAAASSVSTKDRLAFVAIQSSRYKYRVREPILSDEIGCSDSVNQVPIHTIRLLTAFSRIEQ